MQIPFGFKWVVALVVLMLTTMVSASNQVSGPSVASARRALEYRTVDMRTLRPADPASDVLLLIDLAGMTVEEFQKLAPKDIHVLAGATRHETVLTGAGLVNGKTQINVLFNIPKDLLEMQLVIGSHQPIKFTASKTVEAAIQ